MIIRDAQTDDADAVAEIAVAAWRPIYARLRDFLGDELFDTLHTGWESHKAEQVRQACDATESGAALVADSSDLVVGFVSFYTHTAPVGVIGNNAVHPDFQSQGIATRLYECVLARLREAGMRYARVTTGADLSYAPARRAYEKVGFEIEASTVTYYREL